MDLDKLIDEFRRLCPMTEQKFIRYKYENPNRTFEYDKEKKVLIVKEKYNVNKDDIPYIIEYIKDLPNANEEEIT